ncbi:MAG: cupin domain-containing protein [Acidobacteria bacterium]|nr:cupin domain-containing protein [Acidobacteriota bacterium]
MRNRQLIGACLWVVLVIALSIRWIAHAQQIAPQPPDDPRFTGKTSTLDAKELSVSRRRFEAGARSAWHSHERGQLLFVQEGRARIQRRGQPMKKLDPGESDYTGPHVAHWHGAVPGQPLVQVAVGFGGETKWMEKVTDEEYQGKR